MDSYKMTLAALAGCLLAIGLTIGIFYLAVYFIPISDEYETTTTLTDSIEYGGEYTDCEVIKRATYWRVDCLSMIDPGVEIMWFRPGEVAEIVEKWRGEITEGDEHESDI